MPYRTIGWAALAMGVLGVVVMLALWLCRRDITHASHTGPKWRRFAVQSAMLLLSMLGISQAGAMSGCTANCYIAVPAEYRASPDRFDPVSQWRKSCDDLSRRIDLLEKISAGDKISPDVAKKAWEDVDYHLSVLQSEYYRAGHDGDIDAEDVDKLCDRVRKAKAAMRKNSPAAVAG